MPKVKKRSEQAGSHPAAARRKRFGVRLHNSIWQPEVDGGTRAHKLRAGFGPFLPEASTVCGRKRNSDQSLDWRVSLLHAPINHLQAAERIRADCGVLGKIEIAARPAESHGEEDSTPALMILSRKLMAWIASSTIQWTAQSQRPRGRFGK